MWAVDVWHDTFRRFLPSGTPLIQIHEGCQKSGAVWGVPVVGIIMHSLYWPHPVYRNYHIGGILLCDILVGSFVGWFHSSAASGQNLQ